MHLECNTISYAKGDNSPKVLFFFLFLVLLRNFFIVQIIIIFEIHQNIDIKKIIRATSKYCSRISNKLLIIIRKSKRKHTDKITL